MYDPQLENLIDIALKDGEISDKSKSVLMKKAQSLGIDLDEFEMVLDDRVKSLKKNITSGEIAKCPSCGSFFSGLSAICKDCGYEFKNTKASDSITAFSKKLDEIEEKRKVNPYESKELSANIGCVTVLMWICLYPFLIPYNIIIFLINKAKPPKWSNTDLRKEEMIISFPVPSNKEDIMQFAQLCLSKITHISFLVYFEEEGKYLSKWNAVWKTKALQIYKKAETALVEDLDTLDKLKIDLIKKGVFEADKPIINNNNSQPLVGLIIKYEILLPIASYAVIAILWLLSGTPKDNENFRSLLFLGILAALAAIGISAKANIQDMVKKNIIFVFAIIISFLSLLCFFEGLGGTKTIILLGSGLASVYFAYQDKITNQV
ncbi:MAG: hypothetical protein K2X39_03145 [Silvanigrellaceae bacterium]|nr:hypothetical protein [Silvanigrellaceae bacterium]